MVFFLLIGKEATRAEALARKAAEGTKKAGEEPKGKPQMSIIKTCDTLHGPSVAGKN
jgi:hypothetical protein